jgi:M26 IgA1-specific Metallo-endopeptidase N-terminal region
MRSSTSVPLGVAAITLLMVLHAEAACTSITNVNQLQAMKNNLAGDYCLANDIDASTRPNFAPIGDASAPFTGSLNGKGYVISNLTIKSAKQHVGLFGVTSAAVIQHVTLQNIHVRGTGNFAVVTVGALAGFAYADAPNSTTISRVHVVSGQVKCLVTNCDAGGIFGAFGSFTGTKLLRDSSNSAAVTASRFVGGIVGVLNNAEIRRTYATGAVRCTGTECMVGGLVGRSSSGTTTLTFATGPVTAEGDGFTRAGGLIGYGETAATIARSYAAGPVSGGASGYAAGLIPQLNGAASSADQTYAVGSVTSTGATTQGLIVSAGGGPSITNSYWDTNTTGQTMSVAGTGLTTTQLRADLPTGFGNGWGITKTLSYPFLLSPNIGFVLPLATLVRPDKVFIFLPISQLDESQYLTPPENADQAALATVYTMIARAIGITQNVNQLKNVAIDRYFWDDAAQKATWKGPVKNYATLGILTGIPSNMPLDATNVIGLMNMRENVVILRGRYTTDEGNATHWMLGTLYTEDDNGNPVAVFAHDPWTGQQVTIDPATKRVVKPANFPLANFKVNGYRMVTVNN